MVKNSDGMAIEEEANGHDDRFQLDDRFAGEIPEKNKKKVPQNVDSKQHKNSFENSVMVRYDPTVPDHKKFELKIGKDKKLIPRIPEKETKKKKKKKKEKLDRVEVAAEPVSDQNYVQISENLKGYFQNKEKRSEGFSLLKMLKKDDAKSSDSDESEDERPVKKKKLAEDSTMTDSNRQSNPEILNIERLDLEKGSKVEYNEFQNQDPKTIDRKKCYNAKKGKIYCPENHVWYDTLFPTKGDVRFEEGIKWLNTKPEMPENWNKYRRELYFNALNKQLKAFKQLSSRKNPHQQRREHQLNKRKKYIQMSIKMKRGK